MTYSIVTVPSRELATPSWVADVVRRDYSALVKGNLSVDKFVEDNLFPYWLVINCWSNLLLDISHSEGLPALLRLNLQEFGLVQTIIRAASTADIIIRRIHTGEPYDPEHVAYSDGFAREVAKLKPKDALQCLRFPKRFSPNVKRKYSALSDSSVKKFLDINTGNQKIETRIKNGLSPRALFTISVARRIIREIVKDFPGFNEYSFPRFGPGSVRNCTNTPYSKYEYLVTHGIYCPSHGLNLVHITEHPDLEKRRRKHPSGKWILSNLMRPHLGGIGNLPQVSRVTTVPKKVDAERIIAMEDPANMAKQLYLKEILHKRIKHSLYGKYMPITDQETNRQMAAAGAANNGTDTVDYSHASDSVLKVLVQMLFPDDWWRAFLSCIPTGFILEESDSGPRKLNCFATMGCGCTFVVETLVFYSLQLACWCLYHLRRNDGLVTMTTIRAGSFPVPNSISAMGDDCIRPSEIGELVDQVFTELGFSVNHDKTFTNGLFRESCGAEWLNQSNEIVDVTSLYWPRIPVKGNWDAFIASVFMTYRNDKQEQTSGLRRLIDLQHRSFQRFPLMSKFIVEAVRSYAPYMTSSLPGSDCDDLWETDESPIYAVYVGGDVPSIYRWIYGKLIPNGYVVKHMVPRFRAIADQNQRENLRYEFVGYTRGFHVVIREEPAKPEAGFYSKALLDIFRLERSLNNPSELTGFPDIIVGDQRRSLAEVIGLRPWHASYDGVFGVAGISVKLR